MEGTLNWFCCARQQDLPAPFVPAATPSTFTRGDVVWFVGHEIRMDAAGPLILPTSVEAVVRENYVKLNGESREFLAEAVGTTKAPQGVLVDRNGAAISIARSEQLRPARMTESDRRFGRERVEFDSFRSGSMEPFQALLAPEVMFVWNKINYPAGGVELVVQVQLVDVASGTKPLKIMLLGVNGDDDLSYRPGRFHFGDGKWIDKPESIGVEIELQKMSQIDPQIEYSLHPADWPHVQVWSGKLAISDDTTPRHFSYQCVYVEPDGKYRPLGTSGQFFYRVSSDELRKRR